MIRADGHQSIACGRWPRTSGDDPAEVLRDMTERLLAPHERG